MGFENTPQQNIESGKNRITFNQLEGLGKKFNFNITLQKALYITLFALMSAGFFESAIGAEEDNKPDTPEVINNTPEPAGEIDGEPYYELTPQEKESGTLYPINGVRYSMIYTKEGNLVKVVNHNPTTTLGEQFKNNPTGLAEWCESALESQQPDFKYSKTQLEEMAKNTINVATNEVESSPEGNQG